MGQHQKAPRPQGPSGRDRGRERYVAHVDHARGDNPDPAHGVENEQTPDQIFAALEILANLHAILRQLHEKVGTNGGDAN